jgi:hypothetical protein
MISDGETLCCPGSSSFVYFISSSYRFSPESLHCGKSLEDKRMELSRQAAHLWHASCLEAERQLIDV